MLFAENTLSLENIGDGNWNVNYVSDGEEIGGFQFVVDGATINSAFGGAAGQYSFGSGFVVSPFVGIADYFLWFGRVGQYIAGAA